MDSSGEQWRMIRCAAGGGIDSQDKTIINQIMLRFRPIAPKPAGNQESLLKKNKNILVSKKRNKRKYVRVCKNSSRSSKRNRRKNCSSSNQEEKGKENERENGFNEIVTLQLLPERSGELRELAESSARSWCNLQEENNNNNYEHDQVTMGGLKLKQPMIDLPDQTTVLKKKLILESWVTVEYVTDNYYASCMVERGGGLGCTDTERMKNLEEDTRPGFISDGSDSVRWVNGAYKRRIMTMMMKKEENNNNKQEMEIIVWLVTKEKLEPYVYSSAFTCWVRLQYYMRLEKEKYNRCSQMVPCDVWRMDCGGFAWRLDVEAALSLGR